jgi:hypothetical protein
MPEAGLPPGLFASFLYSVKVHLALDVKLFHLSLGTNNFITKGGRGISFKKTMYIQVMRKEYFISLYAKTK